MTSYDLSWKPLPSVVQLPQSETQHSYSKATTSPESEPFDTSTVWYTNPEPYTAQPLTPLSTTFQHKVPEVSRHNSASPIAEGVSTRCSRCGLISLPGAQLAERKFSHVCADIIREQECPDTHVPSVAERRASIGRNSPTHHRRRHSNLYEPPTQTPAFDSELLEQNQKPSEQESSLLVQEASPLEQEDSLLAQESNPLQREVSPLDKAPPLSEQDSDPLG